jgi:DNA-binding beta-propeller fold protein YncE
MCRTASGRRNAALTLGAIGIVAVLAVSVDRAGMSFSLGKEVEAAGPRLVSVEPLPGPMCEAPVASDRLQFRDVAQWASLEQAPVAAAAAASRPDEEARIAASKRRPVRVIRDPYPAYSAIAVDPVRDEVVVTDNNFFQILVYDRLANTAPTANFTEPKRVLGGLRSKIEFQAGAYVDPKTGEIYTSNNDTVDTLIIFPRQAEGNVPPSREVHTPRGGFGLAVDEGAGEMFMTAQHDNSMLVFAKSASGDDSPKRLLQGDRTRLADPRGLALDTKNRLIFIANHGNYSRRKPGGAPAPSRGGGRSTGKSNWPTGEQIPGSGKHFPPSINVYALDAQGDTPPLRTIEGPATRLNWPMGVAFDPKRNEVHVANDQGDEILVFSATASGNVAPLRMIKGPKTLIKNPTGVALDVANDELWVSNYGNHTATAYQASASGDVAPLRVIRSSPPGRPALMIGNPGALAYDSKREEILAPN